MSIPVSPVALTATSNFDLTLPGITSLTQVDWIVLSNNSPYVIEVLCGSILFHVPAWYYYPFPLVSTDNSGRKVRLFSAGNTVHVNTIQQTIPGSSFTAQLFYTLYMNGETPPQTVPSPLGGGPIDLTVASSINQTGQPGGNSVIFAEPVGDSSIIGAVNLNNLGQMTLGDLSNRGALTIEGLSTDPNINLSITGLIRITNSLGNLVTDLEQGFLKLNDSSGINRIDLEAGSQVGLNFAGNVVNGSVGGNVTFYAPIWGSACKLLIVIINGFNSASAAIFNFPSNLVSGIGFMGNLGATTWGIFNGVTAQTLAQVTGLGVAGAAGASTGETVLHSNNLVWFQAITGTNIQIGSTTGAISAAGVFIGV